MYTVKISNKDYNISIDKNEKNKGKIDGKEFILDINKSKEDSYHVLHNNKSYNIEVIEIDTETNEVKLNINGVNYNTTVNTEIDILLKKLGMDNLVSKKVNELKAPMPGLVFKILATVGQEVNEGDTIMVLEAMKMENNLKSPTTGKITEIKVKEGDAVEKNQILLVFE